MQKAALVFYTTDTVREQIEHYGLVDPRRLVKAPLGVSPDFSPASSAEPTAAVINTLPALGRSRYLLHVGSCISRKRVDVLLETFACVRRKHPNLRLVQVGGNWTEAHVQQIRRLGLEDDVIQVRGLKRRELAEIYRRALAVLVTSEAEGFGLPIIEALASGATVVASELPVFREVGGDALVYCGVGDVQSWTAQVDRLIDDPQSMPSMEKRLMQAARYSWQSHADIIANAYSALLQKL
jgi:glycosyltransferase involved in cell wall biosynthesis